MKRSGIIPPVSASTGSHAGGMPEGGLVLKRPILPPLECRKRWSVLVFPANPAVTGLFAAVATAANKTPVRSLPPLDRFYESVRQLDPRASAGRNSNSCMSRVPLLAV